MRCILQKLKKRKACGDDGIPAEFWKVCLDCDILMRWLTDFCNKVWISEQIPTDWHKAKVACLFKKGDPSCPDNYRPISLLQIGYKIFSSLLLLRMKTAGIEQKIWQTQVAEHEMQFSFTDESLNNAPTVKIAT